MIAGARVEVAPYKNDPMDFVLWKPSKPASRLGLHLAASRRPGVPAGISSARRWPKRILGETFDIHGGGIDLVFPHHENEIAQSRCTYHTPFMAKVWMHNGFLQVEGEKMAKSVGNFVTVHELLDGGLCVAGRGDPLEYAVGRTTVSRSIGRGGPRRSAKACFVIGMTILTAETSSGGSCAPNAGVQLSDDLNTPKAIAALHELRQAAGHGCHARAASSLKTSAQLLGAASSDRRAWAARRPPSIARDDDARIRRH